MLLFPPCHKGDLLGSLVAGVVRGGHDEHTFPRPPKAWFVGNKRQPAVEHLNRRLEDKMHFDLVPECNKGTGTLYWEVGNGTTDNSGPIISSAPHRSAS